MRSINQIIIYYRVQVYIGNNAEECSIYHKVRLFFLGRRDEVTSCLHLCLCGKYEHEFEEKWYHEKPEKLIENDQNKILPDFKIKTDHILVASEAIIVIVYKQKKTKKK